MLGLKRKTPRRRSEQSRICRFATSPRGTTAGDPPIRRPTLESVRKPNLCWGDAENEDVRCGGMEEGCRRGDRRLCTLPEPPVAGEPSEGSLDHPAPWFHSEADLAGSRSHDLNRHRTGPANPFSLIATIGEDALDEWEAVTQCAGEQTGAVTVLNRRCTNDDGQQSAVGIDRSVALTTDDPLGTVVIAWPTTLAGLCGLAVHDRRAGRG